MIKKRKKVSRELLNCLCQETGGKCANPGCFNRRTHAHHIKHWAVFQTHDGNHMIAVCPTCHDAIHHGKLSINDETLYRWKSVYRRPVQQDVLTVEGGGIPKIILGQSLEIRSKSNAATIYDLSAANCLRFLIDADDFFLLNLMLSSASGKPMLKVQDNRIRQFSNVHYERVPGHFRVSVPKSSEYFPDWLCSSISRFERVHGRIPDFQSIFYEDSHLTVLDIEITDPSTVKVSGFVCDNNCAIVMAPNCVYCLNADFACAFSHFTVITEHYSDNIFAFMSRTNHWQKFGAHAAFPIGA